jgi:hypothetical protein
MTTLSVGLKTGELATEVVDGTEEVTEVVLLPEADTSSRPSNNGLAVLTDGSLPPPSVRGAAEVEVCRVEVKLKGGVELSVKVGLRLGLVVMFVFEFEENPRGSTSGSGLGTFSIPSCVLVLSSCEKSGRVGAGSGPSVFGESTSFESS